MGSFKEEKERFLNKVAAEHRCSQRVLAAVSLGAGFLIKNRLSETELPIVVCFPDDSVVHQIIGLLQMFFLQHIPPKRHVETCLDPKKINLHHANPEFSSKEDYLIRYCDNLRREGPTLFYYSSYPNCLHGMPSGMFYVIDLNPHRVVGGVNGNNCIKTISKDVVEAELCELSYCSDNKDENDDNLNLLEDLRMNYYLEAREGTLRILFPPDDEVFDDVITIDSPKWQKEACVAIRRYLARECNYMGPVLSDVGWGGVRVYPLVEQSVRLKSGEKKSQGLVGVSVFIDDDAGSNFLSAVWVHPFYRRRGLLSRAWRFLTDQHGQFAVKNANSELRNFLSKVGHKGKLIS